MTAVLSAHQSYNRRDIATVETTLKGGLPGKDQIVFSSSYVSPVLYQSFHTFSCQCL